LGADKSIYSIGELLLLHTHLKEENGHYCQMIDRNIVMSIRMSDPSRFLEHLFYPDLVELFTMSLEQVPLHINDERKHEKIVMKWRLEIAR
jgi:hypothetical protein